MAGGRRKHIRQQLDTTFRIGGLDEGDPATRTVQQRRLDNNRTTTFCRESSFLQATIPVRQYSGPHLERFIPLSRSKCKSRDARYISHPVCIETSKILRSKRDQDPLLLPPERCHTCPCRMYPVSISPRLSRMWRSYHMIPPLLYHRISRRFERSHPADPIQQHSNYVWTRPLAHPTCFVLYLQQQWHAANSSRAKPSKAGSRRDDPASSDTSTRYSSRYRNLLLSVAFKIQNLHQVSM